MLLLTLSNFRILSYFYLHVTLFVLSLPFSLSRALTLSRISRLSCIPLTMSLYPPRCVCLSGAGWQRMRYEDDGVARRRHAEQAEGSAGGGAVLRHHAADKRAILLGPQSRPGGRQRPLPGDLHRNGLRHEGRHRSHR